MNRTRPAGLAFFVEVPKHIEPGTYHLQIQQWHGKTLAGGSEYQLRVADGR